MAYDAELAQRIRTLMDGTDNLLEQKMFGALGGRSAATWPRARTMMAA